MLGQCFEMISNAFDHGKIQTLSGKGLRIPSYPSLSHRCGFKGSNLYTFPVMWDMTTRKGPS